VNIKILKNTTRGFTLLEIMIVSGIMAIIVAIAAPTWLRQREISRSASCQENLCKIDDAKEQYAMDYKLSNGGLVDFPTDLITPPQAVRGQGYLKHAPVCPAGGSYTINLIGDDPQCSIGTSVAPFAAHVLPR
jgi:general secretion pathway protein G